jgi:dTDP-4-amino-4,6-dideoxygalactose transaminase
MGAPRPIPFHLSDVGPEELAAATACLQSGRLGGDGPLCRQAEAALAELTGCRHVLLVTSATHALELALLALGIGPGDEVVLPSFTFPSTANCVLQRGARPVFADVRADTLELDPADAASVLSPRTAAILPVDYGGTAADLPALRAVAGAAPGPRRVALVEDAAQGIASRRGGAHAGAGADAAALSFHATKNLTCGEGGALLLGDEALFRRAEVARDKGTNRAAFQRGEVAHYEWVAQGSSYVLSDLLAAVLLAQLRRLPALTDARRALAARYDGAFAGLFASGLLRPVATPPDARPNGHLYALRTRDGSARDGLRAHLAARGIEAPFHFVPLHTTAFARRLLGPPRALPVTDDAWATLLRLPLYPRLADDEQQRIIDAVHDWASRA